MRTPSHARCRTAMGADLVLVDWPGAPMAEVRWVTPLVRRDRATAALAQVAGRLLLHGPDDDSAARRDERALEQGGVWTVVPSVDRLAISATFPVEQLTWVLGELRERLVAPAPGAAAVRDAVDAERTRLGEAAAHRELALHALLAERRWGPNHPYAHPILGAEEVAAVDPDQVEGFLARELEPAGSTVLVLGDLGVARAGAGDAAWQAALSALAAPLGGVVGPGGPQDRDPRAPGLPGDPGPRGLPPAWLPVPAHEPTASLRLWAPAPVRTDDEHLPLHLAGMVLAGYFGSRLTQELRERRGDVYGVTTGFEVLASAATWVLSLECPADRLDAVRETVHATLADLAGPGPGEDELARATAYAVQGAAVGLASPAALASAGSTVLFAGDDLGLWQRQAAQAARTTARDVAATARRWWDPAALVEVVADPRRA